MDDLAKRLLSTVQSLAGQRTVYVCYSGGVDSTLVLAACLRAGLTTTALLGVSPSLAAGERDDAHRIASELGVSVEEVLTSEIAVDGYRANAGDRCYFCKSSLYETVQSLAADRDAHEVVFVGTQLDDLGEHRPGLKAAEEKGVETPLVAARFHKKDVRALAREWQLPNADKHASPCLASRIPVGIEVNPERLAQIDAVEGFLRKNGIWPARARWHDSIVRLEIPPDLFDRVVSEPLRSEIRRACRKAGFRFVALDLGGMQSGSISLPLATV
jgi:uncharacterized protein